MIAGRTIAANIHRRHMTKGQQAMAVAMIYPEPEQGKRTDRKASTSSATKEVHSGRLSMARTVLAFAPELADGVLCRGVTTGQKAMAYAMRHPEPAKGGRGKKLPTCGTFYGVPSQRVADARAEKP